MNIIVRYADVDNMAPYFVEDLPVFANLTIDYTADPVTWTSYTTPKAVDEDGDMIYLFLNTYVNDGTLSGAPINVDAGTMNDIGEWTWEISPTPNAIYSGIYKAEITLSNYEFRPAVTDGTPYSLYFNLTVIREPDELPYFVEDLPENITFDFTSDSTQVSNVFTSPQAVDPEG